MSPEDRRTFGQLVRRFRKREGGLLWYLGIGRLLKKLAPRQGKQGHAPPGRHWFEDLAAVLGCTPGPLRKMQQFAREYSQDEVERLQELFRERGGELSWSTVVFAFKVPKRERDPLLEEAATRRWSATELKHVIDERYESPRSHTGRPRRRPPDVQAGLKELIRACRKWLTYREKVWAGDRPFLDKLRAGRRTAKDRAVMEQAEAALKELSEAADTLKSELAQLRRA
jgi:hypothetical protein